MRIGAFHSVHPHLRKATVLAVVFHAQTGAEIKPFAKRHRLCGSKKLGRKRIYNRGRFQPVGSIAVTCNHHLFQTQIILFQLKLQLFGFVCFHSNRFFLWFIAKRLRHNYMFAYWQMDKVIMAGFVGSGANGSAFDAYGGKRNMLAVAYYVANDIGISFSFLCNNNLRMCY